MAYSTDQTTGDIIINGFERGIGDSPHPGAQPLIGQYGIGGLGGMTNMNIVSVPGEASVNFSTSAITQQPSSGNVTTGGANTVTITLTSGIQFDSGSAIVFSGGSLPTGIIAGTTYWAVGSSSVYTLYTDYERSSILTISGAGTGTWATVNMGQPKYSAYDGNHYWMVDLNGLVWSNKQATNNFPFYWTYTGNKPNNYSHGNGLVYYAGYIFVFSDSSIDFTPFNSVSWTYQWAWQSGTAGSFNATPTAVLKTAVGSSGIHATFVGADNRVYFCDGSFVDSFYQTSSGTPFVPTTLATYTPDQHMILPLSDIAQCLTQLGTNLLIGGKNNIIYPWDRFSSSNSYPIFIPEYNIVNLITVNTTTFIFAGSRGRIYYTNGSQATLYKKIPDFISGTIEPYFTWGGACSIKNQLYFSASALTNGGITNNNYGGVWAVDLDTKSIRLTNTLSYQTTTYNGYSTTMIPNFSADPSGTGLYIGWDSGSSTYGIDTTISNPYTGSTSVAQGTIDSDLIPIATFLKPMTDGRVEFKLTVPIVSGESIKIQYRQRFSDTFTDIDPNVIFNFASIATGTWNGYSGVYQNVSFQNSQWIQLRAILISTVASPSYVRLFEMRIGS